jgi:hypothetical protein
VLLVQVKVNSIESEVVRDFLNMKSVFIDTYTIHISMFSVMNSGVTFKVAFLCSYSSMVPSLQIL